MNLGLIIFMLCVEDDLVNRFIILKCRFILGRENFMFKISIKEIWNVIKNNV